MFTVKAQISRRCAGLFQRQALHNLQALSISYRLHPFLSFSNPPAKRMAWATSAIGLRMFMLAFLISE
jgi:hypothetical protein